MTGCGGLSDWVSSVSHRTRVTGIDKYPSDHPMSIFKSPLAIDARATPEVVHWDGDGISVDLPPRDAN